MAKRTRAEIIGIPTVHVDRIEGLPLKDAGYGEGIPETTKRFFESMPAKWPLIRSTPLTVLDECPRKFLYTFKLGIQPKTIQRPLSLGSFVHLVLKGLFLGASEKEAMDMAEGQYEQHKADLQTWVDKAGFLPDGSDIKGVLEDLYEDFHKAKAMAICFWRFRPFDPAKWKILHSPDGTPMVERLLELTYDGIKLPIRVPCDLALIHLETNEVWIVDFKTTSFDPKLRAIPTKISPQLALYRLVLQAHLDKWAEEGHEAPRKVAGSMHAILKKPTIKYCPDTKDKKEVGGFSHYIERVIEWYKEREQKDPNNPPLALDPNRFRRQVPLSREFYNRLRKYVQWSKMAPNFDKFYRAGESTCLKFNRPCPYLMICNSDPSMWPEIIRSHYEIRFREDAEELALSREGD